MKIRFFDMIEEYIKKEKIRAAREVEVFKRGVLEDFASFMDMQKKDVWRIGDITEQNGHDFYNRLKYRSSRKNYTKERIRVVNHFMEFAKKEKWIDERPWTRLFKYEKGGTGHFRISEKDRKRLLLYLESWKPKKLFETRDRAMLMILLSYRLMRTEISGLNVDNYNGKLLEINTPFMWRKKEIKLKKTERSALDSYLAERKMRNEAPDEEALFIGLMRRRIAPDMLNQILKTYLNRPAPNKAVVKEE